MKKHKAVITIEVDSCKTDECDISVEMFPPISKDQDNVAALVALRMIRALRERQGGGDRAA